MLLNILKVIHPKKKVEAVNPLKKGKKKKKKERQIPGHETQINEKE